MHVYIDGVEGGELVMHRTADRVLNVKYQEDNGQLIDVTTDTASHLYIYDTEDRRNTALLDITLAVVTAAAGYHSATFTDTQMATLTAGGTYYAFVRREAGATVYSWSPKGTKVKIA